MANLRLIPRLDIKGENLVKGIQLEGLRVLGRPDEFALDYYESGADEIIFIDIVASLYGRNNIEGIVERTAKSIFVPLTVGGGIRSIEDATRLLRAGADKVAINTAAVARPELISDLARRFGSQCVVVNIEAKKMDSGWEVLTENGRERTGLDAIQWAMKAVEMGAGEILLTSVDKEGTQRGFDQALISAIVPKVSVPVVISGGMGTMAHFLDAAKSVELGGVAMASVLHYKKMDIPEIREKAKGAGLPVREVRL